MQQRCGGADGHDAAAAGADRARRPDGRRGDNTTDGPLVEALRRPAIGRTAVVLAGRVTFSAAANFVAEVEGRTRARLIGEPTGGAANQWGDNTVIELPVADLALRLANQYVVARTRRTCG